MKDLRDLTDCLVDKEVEAAREEGHATPDQIVLVSSLNCTGTRRNPAACSTRTDILKRAI